MCQGRFNKKMIEKTHYCSMVVLLTKIVVYYLILCPRRCKWKVAITYIAIRTKTIKIFEYENFLLIKTPQITRCSIEHCDH